MKPYSMWSSRITDPETAAGLPLVGFEVVMGSDEELIPLGSGSRICCAAGSGNEAVEGEKFSVLTWRFWSILCSYTLKAAFIQ